MVDGAIEESDLLSQKWQSIATKLRSMLKEAEAARSSTLTDKKKTACVFIRNHLIALKDTWEQVGGVLSHLC